jgi:hypothetical protein
LIELLNINLLFTMPGHGQAVEGVKRTVGGKGKAGGDGDEDRGGRNTMSASKVEGTRGGAVLVSTSI